jgi:hypothetical protein
MSVGDIVCTSATLSKPWLTVSGGRKAVMSTSSARSSRTERAYSARLSLWKVRPPGFGFFAATSTMRSSSVRARSAISAGSGCGAKEGGIMPARSFRIIFSAMGAFSSARPTSNDSSENPAVIAASLWHMTQ